MNKKQGIFVLVVITLLVLSGWGVMQYRDGTEKPSYDFTLVTTTEEKISKSDPVGLFYVTDDKVGKDGQRTVLTKVNFKTGVKTMLPVLAHEPLGFISNIVKNNRLVYETNPCVRSGKPISISSENTACPQILTVLDLETLLEHEIVRMPDPWGSYVIANDGTFLTYRTYDEASKRNYFRRVNFDDYQAKLIGVTTQNVSYMLKDFGGTDDRILFVGEDDELYRLENGVTTSLYAPLPPREYRCVDYLVSTDQKEVFTKQGDFCEFPKNQGMYKGPHMTFAINLLTGVQRPIENMPFDPPDDAEFFDKETLGYPDKTYTGRQYLLVDSNTGEWKEKLYESQHYVRAISPDHQNFLIEEDVCVRDACAADILYKLIPEYQGVAFAVPRRTESGFLGWINEK